MFIYSFIYLFIFLVYDRKQKALEAAAKKAAQAKLAAGGDDEDEVQSAPMEIPSSSEEEGKSIARNFDSNRKSIDVNPQWNRNQKN